MQILRLITVVFLISLAAPTHAAVNAEGARNFVDTLGKSVVGVVNATNVAPAQKQMNLQQLFANNVDIEWMGKFVLGSKLKQISPEDQHRYLKAYRDYLLARYTTNFGDYTGANYTINEVKNEAEGQYTVTMKIKSPTQAQDTMAGYRVRVNEANQYKIIDIIVEGVSMITTQRAEFTSVMNNQGGLDGLIKSLQDKTQMEKEK